MRTWLILSCLAVTLLVVNAGSETLHKSRVTKELLQKLLQVTKEKGKKDTVTAANLRERVGRVLQRVHNLRDEKKKETPLSKLVGLLKKSLNKRQPDPAQKPNEVPQKPEKKKPVPKIQDPVKLKYISVEDFDEPLEVLEGGDIVEIDDPEAMYSYFMLELFSSKNFCAKPVDSETVEAVGALMTDVSNSIITTLEATITALEAAEGEEQVVQAIMNELFGGFENFSEEEEASTAEGAAMLFRYVLYGTTENTHCEMGDEFWDLNTDETRTIVNRYDRMNCIGNAQVIFYVIMSDPFDPKFLSDEGTKNLTENRCDAAFNYFLENFEEIDLDEMVKAVISDLGCIANKLKDAINIDEKVKRELGAAIDDKSDPIGQAIEAMIEKSVEITVDLTQLIMTLIMSGPQEQEVADKRVLLKTMAKMIKRHHK